MAQVPAPLTRWPLALSQGGTVLPYTFDTQQEDTGIAALLRALTEHGIDFKDLHSSESSLEDLFVSLVHQDKAPAPSAQKAIPA
jgi:ABC-2 type transport system ATP-binding protein